MRADERQAAVAYAYAWWMSGDEDVATAALRSAMAGPDPAGEDDGAVLVALMTGVRDHLGDLRTMPAGSELALLHDGFGVPLDDAARLSAVTAEDAPEQLAHGRLDALLETVREEFRHPERFGDLAVEEPSAVEHAQQCRSCTRARSLIERGRAELAEVSPVSAPPGFLAAVVAELSPDAGERTETIVVHDVLDAPQDYAVAGDDVLDRVEIAPETEAPPPEDVPGPVEQPAEPSPERVPMTRGRRRLAGLLAAAGLLTTFALVVVIIASAGESDPAPDEQPVVTTDEQGTPTPPAPDEPEPDEPEQTPTPFGPAEEPTGFSVVAAGLLEPGGNEIAPSGTTIAPDDPLRLAVDYENGTRGVRLTALWRVDGEVHERLRTVVSARANRHVWGLPVPPGGWPTGEHRVVVSADGELAGAIDFSVRPN